MVTAVAYLVSQSGRKEQSSLRNEERYLISCSIFRFLWNVHRRSQVKNVKKRQNVQTEDVAEKCT